MTDDSRHGTPPGVFEMLWDCPYCGTKGLLGKSHRHCPKCGAPQDPTRRYFPPLGQETAARNTDYDGVDRVCPACSTPCSAAARHCPNCGSPLETAPEVARLGDVAADAVGQAPVPVASPPATRSSPPPGPARPRRILRWLALGAALVVALIVLFTWKRDETVRIAAHAWKREIAVERLQAVSETSWCDQKPGDAYQVSHSREVRSHRRVPDGQHCHSVNSDRGDGTFERHEVCETTYRDEPVYDERCRYTVDRWRPSRTLAANGSSLLDAPRWPAAALPAACRGLGCEREGGRSERYVVTLVDRRGKRHECEVSEAVWARFPVGSERPMRVGVVTGAPDCASLLAR